MEMDKDVVLMGIQGILTLMGLVLTKVVANFGKALERLEKADKDLEERLIQHREDMLKNYITSTDLKEVKSDILDRIDRFEDKMVSIAGRRSSDREQ